MKQLFFQLILSVSLLGLAPLAVLAVMNSSNYQIWADVISVGGGEDGLSASYYLYDTIGEGMIGRSSSTNYSSRAGFREMIRDASVNVLTLTVSANSLALGTLGVATTGAGAHTVSLETNSATGLSVTFSGDTLTCGACSGINTISAIGATAASASAGVSQFGFNVIYNSGDSTATAQSPYDTAGWYAFNSGDEIISASSAMTASANFDLNYIANISGAETAGNYSTTITYTATANF